MIFTHLPSHSQLCIHYYYFTATKNGNCTVDLEWKYQQCSDGIFYVLHSIDGSNYSVIAAISSTGGNSSDETYNYTDNYACPGDGSHANSYYQIRFIRNSDGSSIYSEVRSVNMGSSCSCTNNNTTRCSGLPSLSISGDGTICSSSSQTHTYTLSSSYPATWSITSGGSLVTVVSSDYTQITISYNSSTAGYVDINANVYGCANIPRRITVGVITGALPILGIADNAYLCAGKQFNVYTDGMGDYTWEVIEGTITSGQGTPEIFIRASNNVNEGLYIGIFATNACGLSTVLGTKQGTIYYDENCEDQNSRNSTGNNPPVIIKPIKTLKAFPNPAKTYLIFEVPEKYIGGELKLITLGGQLLRKEVISNSSSKINTIGLSNGIYIAEFKSKSGGVERIRIIILYLRHVSDYF